MPHTGSTANCTPSGRGAVNSTRAHENLIDQSVRDPMEIFPRKISIAVGVAERVRRIAGLWEPVPSPPPGTHA